MTRSHGGSRPGAAASRTVTRPPRRRRTAPATRPSAPLLPLPATTTTRWPYPDPSIRRAANATAVPARATRAAWSTWASAAASAARISATVSTGRTRLRPLRVAHRAAFGHRRAGRVAFGDDQGHGHVGGVGEGDVPPDDPAVPGQLGGGGGQPQRGGAAGGAGASGPDDLDVLQREAAEAAAEGLHGGLLGGEPGGQPFGGVPGGGDVGPLAVGEQAVGQPGPAAEGQPEAVDVDGIDSDADDPVDAVHGCEASALDLARASTPASSGMRGPCPTSGRCAPDLAGGHYPRAWSTTSANDRATSVASSAVAASTITRTNGSVPLGRRRTRPVVPNVPSASRTAAHTASASARRPASVTRTLTSTWGSSSISPSVRSATERPARASRSASSRPLSTPSPVVAR